MKKSKAIAGLLAAASVSLAALQASQARDLSFYPSMVNACDLAVNVPEGAGGYTFSANCKVLYIHPAEDGRIEAGVSLPSTTLDSSCSVLKLAQETYEIQVRRLKHINAQLEGFDATRPLSPTDEQKIERLKNLAEALRGEIAQTIDPYKRWSGGIAGVKLNAATSSHDVQQYILHNQHLIRSGVRIERLPIVSGIMSVVQTNPGAEFPQILNVSNVGSRANVSPDRTGVSSVGGGQVQVELGLSSACVLHEERKKTNASSSLLYSGSTVNDLMRKLLDPRFEYTYPSVANIGYAARINVSRATEVIMEQLQTKGEFKVSDMSELLGTGSSKEFFEMTIHYGNNNPNQSVDDLKSKVEADLIDSVRNRLALRLIDTLRELGFVEVVASEPHVEAPAPGYESITEGYMKTCTSKKLLGHTYKKKCSYNPIVRRIHHDGQAEGRSTATQDFNIDISEVVNINEIERMLGNVTF